MKKVLLAGIALSFISLLWTDVNACGDKFLVVGRGIRYERAYAAKFPASILIYSDNKDGVKDLQSMLKKSGHKIETVGDEAKLFSSLQANKYDVVVVGLSDVALLEKKVISTPSKPAVVPVIYNVTGAELDAAKSQYSCVLKYSNKNKNAVTVIDEVMEARKKSKQIACKWTK
jgi:DNA-binding NtrC family response regulator